jgi:HCOMODA/2-hydroxy-3-carboxy-muconic semialdehyde decarboxylase
VRDEPGREAAAEVARTARVLSRLGFLHAFGHVSARDGDQVLITPTRPPLAVCEGGDVLRLAPAGQVVGEGRNRLPLEAPLHLAVYERRPDAGAICRVHPPAASVCVSLDGPPPLAHGFGGFAEPLALWPGLDLVTTAEMAREVAACLGAAPALLLRGNGALTVGADLAEAAAIAWGLEERCRVALAGGPGRLRPVSADELAARSRWYPNEKARTWAWMAAAGGD